MLWGWLITGLLIWALIPGIDFLAALMIASCVSPTDPILAQAVVGGPWAEKHVPAHIRHMLQCESGCNDGAAFPFLFLAYFLTVNRGQVGFPVAKWFYQTMAWEIVCGTIIGALIGYIARKLIRFSEKHKLVDRESFVAQYLSLAVASMGLNVLIGSDDLLAAFACGTAFAWDGWFQKQTADSNFSSIVDLVFNIATFVYIGAEMPWKEFVDGSINLSVGRLIGLSILVLLLKRLPIVLLTWKFIPDIKTFHEAVFTGYFGPMGVGAIFMCTYGRFSSIVDLVFNIATFVYIGAEMPWKEFVDGSINLSVGRLIGLSILVLLLKRLPIVLLTWKFIPDIKTFHEAVFTGYFGPMGVGAIFMCTYGRILLPDDAPIPPQTPNDVLVHTIQPIVFFFVLSSVIVHGFSIPFFAFGKRAHVNLNRTLTMNTSVFPNSEPSWVNRVRRWNTMFTTPETTDLDQEPGSVVQAMQEGYKRQQLYGTTENNDSDEAEPESEKEKPNGKERIRTRVGFGRAETIDDAEDAAFTDGDDWDGEDTVETRRYRKRLEKERLAQATEGQDITDVHDVEEEDLEKQLAFKDDEDDPEYPRVKEWIEGHNIVLEVIEKPLDEPRTIVIPLDQETFDEVEKEQSPLRSFIYKYEDKIAHAFGQDQDTKLSELNLAQLYSRKLLAKISSFAQERRKGSMPEENATTSSATNIPVASNGDTIRVAKEPSRNFDVIAVRPDGTILE